MGLFRWAWRSDGCRPSGCRAQEVARLLLCACLLCLGKTGAAAAPRGELRHHCEVHTRGHRVGDLDIVFSSSTLAFTRLPLGAGDEHEGSKDTPRVEFVIGGLFTTSPWRIEAGSPHAPAQW